MNMLQDKDPTTRRIYMYLRSKFIIADLYAAAILWVIESQVPTVDTLDGYKANAIINHIKDTIGYPTWFTVQAMFKATFVLVIFDYYQAFHYKDTTEMIANYPEFANLAGEEQNQLLNFRNHVVVTIKLFDPNFRPNDLLAMIEKLCGYTTRDNITQAKRERRELVFFRVTGVVANFEVKKLPAKRLGRPRNRKSNKIANIPNVEVAQSQVQSAEATNSIITNESFESNKRPFEVLSDANHRIQHPSVKPCNAVSTALATLLAKQEVLGNPLNEASEAAYLHLRKATLSSDDEGDAPHEPSAKRNVNLPARIQAEEDARNARAKVLMKRNAFCGVVGGAKISAKSTGSTVEDVVEPDVGKHAAPTPDAAAAPDLATVSSDDSPPTPEVANTLTTERSSHATSCSANPKHNTTGSIAKNVVPAVVMPGATTSGGTVRSGPGGDLPMARGVYPNDGLSVRTPLAHSALSFGLQSMHAILNAHLGLTRPESHNYAFQPLPPPSPAYNTNYPQHGQFGASPYIPSGYSVNPSGTQPYHPFSEGDGNAHQYGAMYYSTMYAPHVSAFGAYQQHHPHYSTAGFGAQPSGYGTAPQGAYHNWQHQQQQHQQHQHQQHQQGAK